MNIKCKLCTNFKILDNTFGIMTTFDYCLECICLMRECNNYRIPNEKYCENCITTFYYEMNIKSPIKYCEYDSCVTMIIPGKSQCFKHTCTFDSCNNMLSSGLTLKYNQKHNYICVAHWSPEFHKNYHNAFKNTIWTFILVLKRVEIQTGLKMPKFMKFEIIKKIDI